MVKINPKLFADTIYPIGIVVEFQDNVDRSNWLGFTWVLTHQDKFPKGRDTNTEAGTQGGEKTHTLTIQEIPNHSHSEHPEVYMNAWGSNNKYLGYGGGTYINTVSQGGRGAYSTGDTGGGKAHNNEPQFEITSYWKRTA